MAFKSGCNHEEALHVSHSITSSLTNQEILISIASNSGAFMITNSILKRFKENYNE